MIAVWIGIFFFVQAIVLLFTLAMCKSAALADRKYDQLRMDAQRFSPSQVERVESKKEHLLSPDTKPVKRYGYSSSDS